jgi:hypothetical protein
VELLWLVDPDRRVVETWTPEAMLPVVEAERITWQPPGVTEPLTIPLAALFADA